MTLGPFCAVRVVKLAARWWAVGALLGGLLSQAQSSAGLLSYVDYTFPYHLELIETATFSRCLAQGLLSCEIAGETGVYRIPLQPASWVAAAEQALEDAWQRFFERTVNLIHQKLNQGPPCWNLLLPCGAHIDWSCVLQRQLEAVVEALTRYQLDYWQEVVSAVLDHLPWSLWWEGPLPLQPGVVLAAVMDGPMPAQYYALIREPRDLAYYFQPTHFPRLPLPFTPDELGLPFEPGLVEKEQAKESLEQATPDEYSQFGFAVFWQGWAGTEDTLFMRWPLVDAVVIPTPSIVSSLCRLSFPPFIGIVPFIPVPTFVPQVPKALYQPVTVPEGYPIPQLEGRPLYALPDLDLPALPSGDQVLPVALQGRSQGVEVLACLPSQVTWPPPGLAVPPDTDPPPRCPDWVVPASDGPP